MAGQMELSVIAHSWLFPAILVLLSLLASCKKDDDDLPQDEETLKRIEVSEWLYDWMKDVYFWNESFPAVELNNRQLTKSNGELDGKMA